ncbi:MAG: sulfite exporter TauE/SafE family protein [Coprobacillaceae bacterium]
MIVCIYSIVIFVATFLGAIAGLGGGVIIKPILDLLGFHDISNISFISTVAVFSMSMYAIVKNIVAGEKIPWQLIVLIALGAMVGGNVGNYTFNKILEIFPATLLSILQAMILTLLLVFVLINMNKDIYKWHIKNKYAFIIVGIILGFISSFLGIGGGPINVAIFVLLFNLELKQAIICSLATIVFSQGSKLITIAISTGFEMYDIKVLFYIIPIAIIGGVLGSYFNKKIAAHSIQRVFNITIVGIIILNIIIVVRNIIC